MNKFSTCRKAILVDDGSSAPSRNPSYTSVASWFQHLRNVVDGIRVGKMEIYQRGRVSRIADTEPLLLIAHLIRPPGSIYGVGRVRRNKKNSWQDF